MVATILMEPRREGTQTGIALDGSGSMSSVYGVDEGGGGLFAALFGRKKPQAQKNDITPVAQKLYAIDPMNRTTLRLMAQAWQFRGRGDSTLYYLTIGDSLLPAEVTIEKFDAQDQSASIRGKVSNFHNRPTAPMKLTFELLNAKGDVVASTSTDVPAIPANGEQPFQVQVIGAGVVAWRYKKG